ncbi:MAG: nucleotide sugar dehydrogenase [Rhizobiales bacterium]|nr:nucleotide sugar dehydrogenase [Hyphomicrobiales bacterium]
MRIALIGTGYVGLVSGVCFAELGHSVVCVDRDADRIKNITEGRSPFHEPGLDEALASVLHLDCFSATTDTAKALEHADICFIAVGTPSLPDGSADTSQVEEAARTIAPLLRNGTVVATKSTVPVGTGSKLRTIIEQLRPDLTFSVASNPEFLREGSAIADFRRPARVVIGADDELGRMALRQVYQAQHDAGIRVVELSLRGAELAKYAANGFLATKVAFINEVADLCERVSVDVDDIALAIGLDDRIGTQFLHAGPGFGGSCFPKDVRALATIGKQHGARQRIIEQVAQSNDERMQSIADRVLATLGNPSGAVVAVCGVAFKPATSDIRESASVKLIQRLVEAGATVRVHDYAAHAIDQTAIPGVIWCDTPYAAARGASLLALVTGWPQYRDLDLASLRQLLAKPVIFDAQRTISPAAAQEHGISLLAVGRPDAASLAEPTTTKAANRTRVHAVPAIVTAPTPIHSQRILVAGGAGFIGQHLVTRLLKEGHSVFVVDNLSSGDKDAIENFARMPNCNVMVHDIIERLPDGLHFDQIYNLACPASPPRYQADPIQTMKTSVLGALNLLDVAERTDARILQASTSEVYGDPSVHPQRESYWGNVNPIGIRACYDEGKRCAETLFFDYHRRRKTRIKVARIFNTYGPEMQADDGRVVSSFIVQALQGRPLSVFGDGSQTRSFCYVDDLVEGLVKLMNSADEITGPVNLGNPEEMTILELATTIQEIVGQVGLEHFPAPADDPTQRRPDISRAQELLGWKPTTLLRAGLIPTIRYFESELQRLDDLTRRRVA